MTQKSKRNWCGEERSAEEAFQNIPSKSVVTQPGDTSIMIIFKSLVIVTEMKPQDSSSKPMCEHQLQKKVNTRCGPPKIVAYPLKIQMTTTNNYLEL